ncbi:helicase-associated domain-containing protein [Phytohabitans sp. ZYX-F-186]|uniref:Helicase-associated domain-containing protein n=1 Tax=Phytohabitans maris TaxID=3071409 RepID=A0ABU0ZER7_9ACTN|nr:helicase-associated domain-containing protein [Phytohabitans sp. ZYX-F-186]MDQ7904847.1 helicase-associated domain-containing protein [Phytohabitans sp. ZYX-F-186]
MTSPLVRWLASLSTGELAAVLARRPEALDRPQVSSLSGLAGRLQDPDAVMMTAGALPLPALQLVEVLQAFGGPLVGLDQLATALGRKPDDAELAATLAVLAQRALVWPDGDELRMAGPLWNAFEHPLHLGLPARRLLEGAPVTTLHEIAAALELPRGRTRTVALTAVCAALADGERVRSLVAAAPVAARDLLAKVAWDGPLVVLGIYDRPGDGPLGWALRHGLLVSDGWQHAQMPGEVGMALRGPDWRAPFDPLPPAPELVEVAAEAVEREAAAAATTAVEQASALLGAVAAAPVGLIKAGGVGSRELRRLAKSVGCGEPEVRLWLELAYAAGLVGVSEMRVLPTESYDEWCAAEPAGRLLPLLRAWPHLPAAPLAADGTPALTRDAVGMAAYDLRPALLQAAAELPSGQGAAGGLAEALGWRLPMLADDPALVDGLWREAHLVGALAHGALTPLGRALLDGAALEEAISALLPSAVAAAVFQNDLTAVVPGTPTAALAGLLDAAADRESGGGAVTWRFSPASVRAALDAGHTPDGLLADLRGAAVGGSLPQVLEYLVGDVGRRHGQVRVRAVGCVVRADDPALLAEIAGVRSLRPLGLAVLAPTVLASVLPMAQTLSALRAAGYAPSGEDADGVTTVERAPRHRVPAPRRPERNRTPRTPADLSAIAAKLLSSYVDEGEVPAVRPTPMSVARDVRDHAPHLSTAQRLLLIGAVSQGTPIEISYTDGEGESTRRVVEPAELDGPKLSAWCRLRDDERVFLLSRIESVSPVP